MYPKWNSLYKRTMLTPEDYRLPTEDLLAKVESNWRSFVAEDLPMLTQELAGVQWRTDA